MAEQIIKQKDDILEIYDAIFTHDQRLLGLDDDDRYTKDRISILYYKYKKTEMFLHLCR